MWRTVLGKIMFTHTNVICYCSFGHSHVNPHNYWSTSCVPQHMYTTYMYGCDCRKQTLVCWRSSATRRLQSMTSSSWTPPVTSSSTSCRHAQFRISPFTNLSSHKFKYANTNVNVAHASDRDALTTTLIDDIMFMSQGRYGLCRFLRDGYKTPKEVRRLLRLWLIAQCMCKY